MKLAAQAIMSAAAFRQQDHQRYTEQQANLASRRQLNAKADECAQHALEFEKDAKAKLRHGRLQDFIEAKTNMKLQRAIAEEASNNAARLAEQVRL